MWRCGNAHIAHRENTDERENKVTISKQSVDSRVKLKSEQLGWNPQKVGQSNMLTDPSKNAPVAAMEF